MIGGDYGPASACGGAFGGSNNSIRKLDGRRIRTNILIDGVTIHDVQSLRPRRLPHRGPGDLRRHERHRPQLEVLRQLGLRHLPPGQQRPDLGRDAREQLVRRPGGHRTARRNGRALGFSGVNAGVTIRNNSFNDAISLDDNGNNPQFTSFVVTGNIGELLSSNCSSLRGIQFSYNVWRGAACGGSNASFSGGLPVRPQRRTTGRSTSTSRAGPPWTGSRRRPPASRATSTATHGPRAPASTPGPTRSGARPPRPRARAPGRSRAPRRARGARARASAATRCGPPRRRRRRRDGRASR